MLIDTDKAIGEQLHFQRNPNRRWEAFQLGVELSELASEAAYVADVELFDILRYANEYGMDFIGG